MALSENIRRCVVFLGGQGAGPIDEAPIVPKGTAFVMHGGKELGPGAFLVTAKHVAQKTDPPFVIRINKTGGGADLVHVDHTSDIRWCYHPTDKTADVAVAAIDLPSWADLSSYGTDGVLVSDLPNIAAIGARDIAFVVGLFHLHSGKRSNLPIVHTGHIAMLPGAELIPVEDTKVEGYLVQTNAISGCSGSPVFACNMLFTEWSGRKLAVYEGRASLIGVWSASWKVKRSEIVAVRTDDGDEEDEKGTLAPLGMGIVTPVSKLADILRGEELMQSRERLRMHRARDKSATHG
jgi:hypothetical protein